MTTVTGKTMRVSHGELRESFVPVNRNGENGKVMVLFQKMNDDLSTGTLISTLNATLEKLKTDPAYIPQASAINETAKTMIEIGKLQVEMVKAAKGL